MKRLLLALTLCLLPISVSAQTSTIVIPPLITPAGAVIVPASAINGSGTASTTIKLQDGTAAAPSLASASDVTRGMSFPAANMIAWSIGGAEYYRFSSNDNFVIGGSSGLAWSSNSFSSGAVDLRLLRGGSGLLNLTDADGTPDLNLNVSGSPSLTTCGDGALATGSSNTSGRLVSSNATACTLTFSTSFAGNSTDCFIENLTANRGNVTAASSTAFTVSNLTAGDDFMYWCVGR